MADDASDIDLSHVSVIIPLKYDENTPHLMIRELEEHGAEVILSSEGSRARSLNKGACRAGKPYLWFLHADSTIDKKGLKWLCSQDIVKHDVLNYFRLGFINDGPFIMVLNAWGANVRSRFFGTPFGDQGFFMHRDLYNLIGPFPQDVRYGEDHIFVWHARQKSIRLNQIPATIKTSARRYKKNGWFKTTCLFQYLWIKQALPEYWRLLFSPRA